MKRIILLSFVSMLLSVGTTMAEGISSARELVAFATAANAGEDITPWADREGVISLTADIDMAKVKDFVPIAVFDGIFDGGCHTISNWKTTAGLFHIVSEKAVVRNLTIDASCSMKCTDNGEEEFYAGFIADVNHGTLEGCINRGQISHRSGKSLMSNYVGGICGMNKYIVINCDNYGNVSSSGNFGGNLDNRSAGIYLGGVVGGSPTRPLSCAFIGYCDNHGTITYSGAFPNNYIGGIAGSHTYVKVKFCTNRGNVTVAAKSISESDVPQGLQVGGICGLTKGDIVCSDNFGEIIARFEKKGFKLVGLKMMVPPMELLEQHYAEHKGKPFFPSLISYITSGPVMAMVLEGENAVSVCRGMMGKTNPAESAPGTIRGDYAMVTGMNIIHGSDSVESAKREISIFFKPEELVSYDRTADKWIYE